MFTSNEVSMLNDRSKITQVSYLTKNGSNEFYNLGQAKRHPGVPRVRAVAPSKGKSMMKRFYFCPYR